MGKGTGERKTEGHTEEGGEKDKGAGEKKQKREK